MSGKLMLLLSLAATVAVPVVLLSASVRLLASPPAVRAAYARPGFPAPHGMSEGQRVARALTTTRFVAGLTERTVLEAMRGEPAASDESARAPLYTASEIEHLVDVRHVLRRTTWAGVVGTVLLAFAILRLPTAAGALAVARGGLLTLLLVAGLGGGIALFWPLLFRLVHELLFPPGTWTFPSTNALIRLFPMTFWRDAAIALSAFWAASGAVVAWASRRLVRAP